MRAKKENKVYQIKTDAEKERYLKEGFDIYNDEGEIIAHSPKKKVLYSEYDKVKKECEATKKELEEVKAAQSAPPADDPEVLQILTQYAAEHEVDIGKATTIKGIVKKIQEAAAGEGGGQ